MLKSKALKRAGTTPLWIWIEEHLWGELGDGFGLMKMNLKFALGTPLLVLHILIEACEH
jgi:hypothetical protein